MSRTIPNIAYLLDPVEQAIHHKLLPALTGRSAISDLERELFSLSCCLGGMNIVNPLLQCFNPHFCPHIAIIIQQNSNYPKSVKMSSNGKSKGPGATNAKNRQIRPPHCIDNFLSRCSKQWIVPVRRAHQAGCRHYPLWKVISPSIRKRSGCPVPW